MRRNLGMVERFSEVLRVSDNAPQSEALASVRQAGTKIELDAVQTLCLSIGRDQHGPTG